MSDPTVWQDLSRHIFSRCEAWDTQQWGSRILTKEAASVKEGSHCGQEGSQEGKERRGKRWWRCAAFSRRCALDTLSLLQKETWTVSQRQGPNIWETLRAILAHYYTSLSLPANVCDYSSCIVTHSWRTGKVALYYALNQGYCDSWLFKRLMPNRTVLLSKTQWIGAVNFQCV